MNKTDYLALDGKGLAQLQLIYRLGSISNAAKELGVNQSTVSHNLDRLRRVLNDPLFIKSGRGLVASAKMEAMQGPIDDVLSGLARVANPMPFEPEKCHREFSIVANDFEHDIIVPPLFKLLAQHAPGVRLRTHISSLEDFDPLLSSRVDVELTPRVPTGTSGLVAQALLQDELVMFYDGEQRSAPKTLDDCLNSRHATAQFDINPMASRLDQALLRLGKTRQIAYTAPSFSTLGAVLRGTDLIASCPSRLAQGSLQDLQYCKLPVEIEPLKFLMVWHVKHRESDEHRWFRQLIRSVADQKMSAISDGA